MEAFTRHSLRCREAFGRARRALRRGLFYREDEASDTVCKSYCGTFYYYEPESTTFLAHKTSYRSFNKVTAFEELMDMLEAKDPHYWDIVADLGVDGDLEILEYRRMFQPSGDHSKLKLFISGKLPADLMISPNQLVSLAEEKKKSRVGRSIGTSRSAISISYQASRLAAKIPQRKYYAGAYLGFYALEDEYDQAICLLCKRLGIDLLILEKMVGSFQVVTEVLDSRSRTDSLRSLVYLM